MARSTKLSSWGNNLNFEASITDDLSSGNTTIRGNGRSYGDAALGDTVYSRIESKDIRVDTNKLELHCDGGVLLRDILNYLIPLGYTLNVIPGTQFVTLGGMIASDVHGKNHYNKGSFGNWVTEFTLKQDNNTVITCSKTKNNELFSATIGGMGLTGLIRSATVKITPLKGTMFSQKTTNTKNLETLFNLFESSTTPYKVAWLDILNKQPEFLFFESIERNEHLKSLNAINKPLFNCPKLPFGLLSKRLMLLYNKLYIRKNKKTNHSTLNFSDFHFPLDKINNWNRLYGPNGLLQYQFIIPKKNALTGMSNIIDKIKSSKYSPYLAVMKQHQENSSPGYISFPLDGYSLAVDFPYSKGLEAFFNELDDIVITHEGRIYLAKDACLQPESLLQMYPKINEFKSIIRNLNFSSNLAKRLKLK